MLLEKENDDLEAKCAQMVDYIETTQVNEEAIKQASNKEHQEVKSELKAAILKLKFELDKVLSVKININ